MMTYAHIVIGSVKMYNYIYLCYFRCTQTVDKSLTKAIWIIYIILAKSRTRHALPMRIRTLMQFKLFFKCCLQSNGQSEMAAMTRPPSQML